MRIENVVVGPFQCNCRILVCPRTGEAALVDPGDEAGKILKKIQELKTPGGAAVTVKYLLHTHGHLDHIGGTRELRSALASQQPRISLHRGDEPLYMNLKMQGNLFGLTYEDPLPVDH